MNRQSYQAMYIYITYENIRFLALGAKPMSYYFGSRYFENWAIFQIFRPLDRLSSLSGEKIMAQKTKIG